MKQQLNLVAIGGGTGLATLLSGLKQYVREADSGLDQTTQPDAIAQLTAIVTVTDDGGSSGRLRDEFRMLPPGDIRNCLVALAEDEQLLTRLFRHRFEGNGQLGGHSFGNIFLTALTEVTGDFLEAIRFSSEVLAIKGRIFPSTVKNVWLEAELVDGSLIRGECNITKTPAAIRSVRLDPPDCAPLRETLEAIEQADMLVIGPGSLFTSLIPNLLVKGVPEAIVGSSAKKIYICNIMTQPNETVGYTAADHVERLIEYCPGLEPDLILINSRPISKSMLQKYEADGADPVRVENATSHDPDTGMAYLGLSDLRVEVPLLYRDLLEEKEMVRHHPTKLSRAIFEAYRILTGEPSAIRSQMSALNRDRWLVESDR